MFLALNWFGSAQPSERENDGAAHLFGRRRWPSNSSTVFNLSVNCKDGNKVVFSHTRPKWMVTVTHKRPGCGLEMTSWQSTPESTRPFDGGEPQRAAHKHFGKQASGIGYHKRDMCTQTGTIGRPRTDKKASRH